LAAFALAFVTSSPAAAQYIEPVTPYKPPSKTGDLAKRAARRQLPSFRAELSPAFPHRLPALEETEFPERLKSGETLAGVHRSLPAEAFHSARWDSLPDGRRVWRVSIESPGAKGLRVHFEDFRAGDGRVWVHDGTGEDSEIGGPYTGGGPFGDGDFWSDYVMAETIVVEYEPAGAPADGAVPFRIRTVAHMLPMMLKDDAEAPKNTGAFRARAAAKVAGAAAQLGRAASASCNLDVNCYPQWSETSKAIGHIVLEKDGWTGFCSGTLLTTRNRSGIPYFLTADHCVDSDTVARTVQSFWMYQTDGCNGAPRLRRDSHRVLGARYVGGASKDRGDFTLLRLSNVPADALFSGWNPNDIPDGAEVAVIHHPGGDHKRISFGTRVASTENHFQRISYFAGVTEGGSSGSGLFSSPGLLNGLLSSGPKAETAEGYCSIQPFVDNFGKFSSVYAVLSDYLEDRVTTVPTADPPPGPANPIPLISGQPAAFSLDAVSGPFLFNNHKSMVIHVPEGATRLEIRVATQTPGADVDLFARFGSDVALEGTSAVADWRSQSPTGEESITITPESNPSLRPGLYYIALALFTPGIPVTGTVTATVTSGSGAPSGNHELRSGEPQWFALEAVSGPTLFNGPFTYTFDVPEGAQRVEIRVNAMTDSDIDLFVRHGGDVDVADSTIVADHSSEGPTGTEVVTITPASSPQLRPGRYYVSLLQWTENTAALGTIGAVIVSGGGNIPEPGQSTRLISGQPARFSLPAVEQPTLYVGNYGFTIDVPEGAGKLTIDLSSELTSVDVDLFVRHGEDIAFAEGGVIADHASESETGRERIVIGRDSDPPLKAGTYYISVGVFSTGVLAEGTVTATVESGKTLSMKHAGHEVRAIRNHGASKSLLLDALQKQPSTRKAYAKQAK
jgi:hypothetical protein